MSQKYLQAAKCSQMSSPKPGTGSGGDRCTEACAAMIDATYKLGPAARAAKTAADVEAIMYALVGVFPNNAAGSVVSHLENFGVAFPNWLQRFSYNTIISLANTHQPVWSDVKRMIDAAHIAVIFQYPQRVVPG